LEPLEIVKNVYWVGAVDWEERDFHRFEIHRGTTYNAYLIVDEKTALIDTVKDEFFGEMAARIRKIVDLSEIDYVVSNHVEMDHSGSLPKIMKLAEKAVVVCTEAGKKGLCRYYHECEAWNFRTVKTGDELKLGKKTLMFLEMPMLHWPDSMATYIKEDRLLMPNDAFGQHVASAERFDEELGIEEALKWAKIYYANILMPFGDLVRRKLEEVVRLGLAIEMIAPSHGIIWKNPSKIIEAYRRWASFQAEAKLVTVYDTMWGSTFLLAKAIVEGAESEGVEARLFHVRKDCWAEILTEILDSKGLAIGSPTVHNGMFPPVAGFLAYLKSLKPRNKVAVAFSSYGWGGGASKEITKLLQDLKFEVLPALDVQYRPTAEDLDKAFSLGRKLAEKIKGSL